jgi:hypothetical protein
MIFRNTPYDMIFNAPAAGLAWTTYVSKEGGAYVASSASASGNNDKSYTLSISSEDMDANIVNLKIEENSPYYYVDEPIILEITIVTDDPLTYNAANYLNQLETDLTNLQNDVTSLAGILPGLVGAVGTVVWTYIIYTDATLTIPLESCLVKMTSDAAGEQDLKEQYTNALGETKWLVLPGGIYYMWRQKSQWRFTNPDIQIIPLVAPFSAFGI